MDKTVGVTGDWLCPDNSPGGSLASFMNEQFASKPVPGCITNNGSDIPSLESGNQDVDLNLNTELGEAGVLLSHDQPSKVDASKSSSRSSLAERVAARAGFIPTTLNTSPDVRSPYLTISPGLSPTMLLDSPVFLSHTLGQPSPTTGKFLYGHCDNVSPMPVSVLDASDKFHNHALEDVGSESFHFKPRLEPNSSCSTARDKAASTNLQQSSPSTDVSIMSPQKFSLQPGFSYSSEQRDSVDDIAFPQKECEFGICTEQSSTPDDQLDGEVDRKGESSAAALGAPAEDGYNWRKYGQKQVKGSEFPRSYYKCTHPNCPVKKKVERSHEGHITEIIYKGGHNHPMPPPARRSGIMVDGSEYHTSQCHNLQNDGLETTSSGPSAIDLCDPSASVQALDGSRFESPDDVDVSSIVSNYEDEDDRATHGSTSQDVDGDGVEMESKRRKLDTRTMDLSSASRGVREPRVVVQTVSEVDILDDGYRWRKYGQKVVKGNPNPRSYYKCTNPGCSVRKHVERASHDLKSVITTYEGKHNHEVPAARNSGLASSVSSLAASTAPAQSHYLQRRPEPISQNDRAIPMPGGVASGFFSMTQNDLANLAMTRLSNETPLKMPVLPPAYSYLGALPAFERGFPVPKGESEEGTVSESGLPMLNQALIYRQMMMSRLRQM